MVSVWSWIWHSGYGRGGVGGGHSPRPLQEVCNGLLIHPSLLLHSPDTPAQLSSTRHCAECWAFRKDRPPGVLAWGADPQRIRAVLEMETESLGDTTRRGAELQRDYNHRGNRQLILFSLNTTKDLEFVKSHGEKSLV